jgi:pseudoazurin
MKLPVTHAPVWQPAPSLSRRQGLALLGFGAAALALRPSGALSQTASHTITAHNRTPEGTQMAFAPAVLHVAPGDSVHFAHADRGHNVQSYDEMRPEGAAGFGGGIGEEIDVTFDVEGTYGFFCRPHQGMGMIGFVLVGDFTGNLEAVRAAVAELRGPMIARRAEEYFAEISRIGQSSGLI